MHTENETSAVGVSLWWIEDEHDLVAGHVQAVQDMRKVPAAFRVYMKDGSRDPGALK